MLLLWGDKSTTGLNCMIPCNYLLRTFNFGFQTRYFGPEEPEAHNGTDGSQMSDRKGCGIFVLILS